MKSLDQKIASIRANPQGAKDFILADAKDADMATGLAATGKDPVTGRPRSLAEYRDQMREIVRQGLVDIMLMSASTSEVLTMRERLFDNSAVTPAARANDTTDIHLPAGGTYGAEPSRPFQSTTIDHIQAGKIDPTPQERSRGANLGLYSITPNNRIDFDYVTLNAYKEFRLEAERKGFRHFLEVFDPNACAAACPADLGRFINDLIVRTLAGVPSTGRPLFLKIPYHGPRAMEELVAYDPTLVPGILGGSSGTTHDAFKLLEEAKRHGARAALFGRKINNSEHQLTFVTYLHAIANGKIMADEAVKAYHGDLERLKIKPYRSLKADMELTVTATSYAGSTAGPKPAATVSAKPAPSAERPKVKVTMSSTGPSARPAFSRRTAAPAVRPTAGQAAPAADGGLPKKSDGSPDFSKMSAAQKVAYSMQRIKTDIVRNGNGDGQR
ncbi:MAG TPA: hypothetical protein VFB66_00540 [Tepidisphaeraceae bacterium]|nr:hypothetical protein [Tepidisphaeraceae bacterium]